MQELFIVSRNGNEMGPFTVDQIVEKMRTRELDATDFLYDEAKADWILLLDHGLVSNRIKDLKPTRAPSKTPAKIEHEGAKAVSSEVVPAPSEGEWYVLKGDNKFGPFTYLDLVRMLQEKVIFEFDYVWNSEMVNWSRVAELKEFSPTKIESLVTDKKSNASNVFFRRRHRRVKFSGSIIVHDNKNVWKGQAIEISEGGAGIIMENSMILPGQTLYLHFKPGDGVPPFNAVCEVVSKKYVDRVSHKDTPIRYGVKFITISSGAQKSLQEYSEKNKEDAA